MEIHNLIMFTMRMDIIILLLIRIIQTTQITQIMIQIILIIIMDITINLVTDKVRNRK